MKSPLEIDPEIRGLLEEIVADPRSAIRLAPRRALREWFDTGETARASDVAETKAERHLIEAYREEVAELLCEASGIAYFKAPVFVHRELRKDGTFAEPLDQEPAWQLRARRALHPSIPMAGTELLEACLGRIEVGTGFTLARASLQLVPSDRARESLALNVPWKSPQLALVILKQISGRPRTAHATLEIHALRQAAARLCSIERFAEAREFYRTAATKGMNPTIDFSYALNLACHMGAEDLAFADGRDLNRCACEGDKHLDEARKVIQRWAETRSPLELDLRAKTVSRVLARMQGPVSTLLEVQSA